jgi:NAD(P)-dependent dehydrogenase (short-subunit alcohol dehydrogenase family)
MRTNSRVRDFNGKVAVITGAGSGIARSLAVALARQGAILAISDIDTAGLKETASLCEASGTAVKADYLDIADPAAIRAYAGDVGSLFGRINQLYNIAGIGYFGEVEKERLEDMRRILDVNFWGTVCGTQAFLPHLIESGDGHIIHMSSLFGLVTFPGQSAYSVSKFAVRGFTDTLRQEMLATHREVRVTCVYPGGIKTGIARSMRVAEGLDAAAIAGIFDKRLALHGPDKAAAAILAGVRAGKARVVIGAEAKALDWLSRITPAGAQRFGLFFSRSLGLVPAPRSAL